MAAHYRNFQLYFFGALLLLSLWLTYLLFAPYLGALLLAATLAVLFYPLYRRLHAVVRRVAPFFKGKLAEIVSAFVTLLLMAAIMLLPLTFIGFQLVSELRSLYENISEQDMPFHLELVARAEQLLGIDLPDVSANLNTYVRQSVGFLAQHAGSFVAGIGRAAVALLISLIAFYYFLKDGKRLKEYIIKLSPLPDVDDEKIMSKLKGTVNSVVRGSLMIAVIQGVLTGVGFALFGVPNATLWGSVAAVTALIPSVGTSLVLIPGILYLFFASDVSSALGMTIWGFTAVGLIDNLLGPYLLKQGTALHPFVVLLSVLGGIALFGPIGFLIGPLIVSLLIALLDLYADHILTYKKSTGM